jgi:hypothetical protein
LEYVRYHHSFRFRTDSDLRESESVNMRLIPGINAQPCSLNTIIHKSQHSLCSDRTATLFVRVSKSYLPSSDRLELGFKMSASYE